MHAASPQTKILTGLALLGLLGGAWGIIEALMYGTNATGLTSYVPWGLGVALYLTFLGFSAGGLPLALATTVFGKHEYEELAGLVAWTVVVTELCAGLAIILDLGHMERMYRFMIAPSFTSPMAWMFVFFNALLLVYIIKIWALLSNKNVLAHRMTMLSVPVALLFYGTNGYIFGVLTHHPIWGGPLVPFYFIIAALMAGTALMCFLSWALGYKSKLTIGVGYGVLSLILLFALLEILIGLTGFQSGDVDTKLTLNAILTGGNGTVFWVLHVGLGMVIPVILLLRNTSGSSALASLCVMASFLATRWVFVIPPQSVPPLPGLAQAFIDERLALTYTPHFGEWLVVLFVFSLALLGFVLGPRLLPGLFQQGGKNV